MLKASPNHHLAEYNITVSLYTSDAADDTPCVDLGGRRIIKKKKTPKEDYTPQHLQNTTQKKKSY